MAQLGVAVVGEVASLTRRPSALLEALLGSHLVHGLRMPFLHL